MKNCNNDVIYQINFKNCTFPDFKQELICLGSWNGIGNNNKFVGIIDKETKHIKCGILNTKKKEEIILSLSMSGNCKEFHGKSNNAFEEYIFQESWSLSFLFR